MPNILLDLLALQEIPALPKVLAHEKLVPMNIHQQIKQAREAMKWSMSQLAEKVSEAEGLKKPLTWQTVQQWENGKSAPSRKRMQIVLQVLGLQTAVAPPLIPTVESNIGVYQVRPQALPGRSTLLALLMQLAQFMETQDQPARDAAATLLGHLCQHPENADTLAKRIVAMLDVPANTAAQKSINSPTSATA